MSNLNVRILAVIISLVTLPKAYGWDLKDLKEEALVPVTETGSALAIGAGVTLGVLSLRNPHGQNFEVGEKDRNGALSDYASWGDYAGQLIPNAGYAIYQGALGFNGDSEGYRRALGMIKATAYAGTVTSILKYSIRAPRPTDSSTRNSFPSGHSATVFTFSGYVAAEHGWGWGTASTLLALYCGYSRIHDQMHRLHEVSAGATLGIAYGWGISKLQRKKLGEKDEGMIGGFNIAPIFDGQTKGLSFYKEF